MTKTRRRITANVALICGIFAAVIAPAFHPAAAGAPAFTGSVVDSSNQPLTGVTVVAGHDTLAGSFLSEFVIDGQATTNAQGTYSITTVGPGDGSGNYGLAAQLNGYVTVVYPSSPCVGPDTCLPYLPSLVTPPLSGADFQLIRAGSISGTVTRTDTGAPVCCMLIYAAQPNGPVLTVNADSNGNFDLTQLLPGSYQVIANVSGVPESALLLSQAYAGHDFDETFPTTQSAAWNVISLAEGQDTDSIDFALRPGVFFSGTITSAINGAPLSTAVWVRRRTPYDSGGYYQAAISANYAAPNPGSYTSFPLAPGSVTVSFVEGDAFAPQYYSNAADEASAQNVVLTGGQATAGIDAQLTTTRSFAGTITDANTHLPLQQAVVHAGQIFIFLLEDEVDAVTDASGNYLLQGLASTSDPGMPPLSDFYIWVDGAPGYIYEYYPGVIDCCGYPPDGATTLTLTGTQQLTGIDFSLSTGAYASGRIYDPLTNGGIAGSKAQLYNSNGQLIGPEDSSGDPSSAASDLSGSYVSAAVPVGRYYVGINSPLGTILYPNAICPNSGCDFSQAQLLDFAVAQNYPGLDFAIPNIDLIFRSGFDQ